MTSKEALSEKATEILESAQSLMQDKGYNGFSFRDVAAQVGIKSASIHYHFPTKGDLAKAAVRSYRDAFSTLLADISALETTPRSKLRKYGDIFVDTLTVKHNACLCGILASEAESLPDDVRHQVDGFFDDQRVWLSNIIETGIKDGTFRSTIATQQFAISFLAALEGAMIIARSTQKTEVLEQTINQMIDLIKISKG
ncbi:MAG: TetR/AcrR family transcriptional regulator [Sulfitobacter sp.]